MSSGASDTFKFSDSTAYDRSAVVAFLTRSLRNRRRTGRTLSRVTGFVRGFYEFTHGESPRFPFRGKDFSLGVAEWMVSLEPRWASIPAMGRYALRVFGEALGVVFPIDRPSVFWIVAK